MVIIDTVINTLLGGLTLDPAGMHCPSWDDAVVSSFLFFGSLNGPPAYPVRTGWTLSAPKTCLGGKLIARG